MLFEKRQWGWMIKLFHVKHAWLKLLWVPGRTSYQSHSDRTEWHFGLYRVRPGEKHRLQHGLFIELALGKPKEEDIVRYEDDYGRH